MNLNRKTFLHWLFTHKVETWLGPTILIIISIMAFCAVWFGGFAEGFLKALLLLFSAAIGVLAVLQRYLIYRRLVEAGDESVFWL